MANEPNRCTCNNCERRRIDDLKAERDRLREGLRQAVEEADRAGTENFRMAQALDEARDMARKQFEEDLVSMGTSEGRVHFAEMTQKHPWLIRTTCGHPAGAARCSLCLPDD